MDGDTAKTGDMVMGDGEGEGVGSTFSRVYEDVATGKAVTTGAGMLSEASGSCVEDV